MAIAALELVRTSYWEVQEKYVRKLMFFVSKSTTGGKNFTPFSCILSPSFHYMGKISPHQYNIGKKTKKLPTFLKT